MERSLTQGKPYQQIIRFTIPLLIGNLFQQFYNMADAFIISRTLGVEAFAGVSSTGGISFLILGFAQGLTAGLSIAIAQSFGAEDYDRLKKQYVNNLIICILTAVVLTVISLIGARAMLEWLRTPADIFDYAYEYLQIIFVGIIASIMFNIFANTMRALGDSRTPLIYLFIASILNIILDYILIRYASMGMRGAAIATVISQSLSAILCLITIIKRVKILSLKGYNAGFDLGTSLQNLKLGLPMAFQSSIIALGVIFMQFATNGMGTLAVASYAVASKIDGIAVEPLRSFGMAMSTYTAQNYGGKQVQRIITGVKQCTIITFALSIVLGLLMYLGGRWITALFLGSNQPEILEQSHTFLIIHGSLYIILALLFVFRFTLQGLGHATIPTVAGIMELLMRLISAAILVPRFGFLGAAISTPLSWAGALIPVTITYFLESKRLKSELRDSTARDFCTTVSDVKSLL